MDFELVEQELVNKLNAVFVPSDKITAIPVPEDNVEFNPKYGERQVIVAFVNEDGDPNENLTAITQTTLITFGCLLQGKKLRGEKGLYKLAEIVKQTLIGFRPTDLQQLTYSNHKFIRNEQKIFEYMVEFKTQGVRVQDVTEDESGPLFKNATYQD